MTVEEQYQEIAKLTDEEHLLIDNHARSVSLMNSGEVRSLEVKCNLRQSHIIKIVRNCVKTQASILALFSSSSDEEKRARILA